MDANLAALLYLVSGLLFILRAARPVFAGDVAAGQSRRHDRHGDRGRHDAVLSAAGRPFSLAPHHPRHRHRRRHRRVARAHHPNDGDAAARRPVSRPRRPCRRAGRGERAECAAGFRLGDRPIHVSSLIEMSLGAAIGALTFTGSVIAFLKLDGRMSGKPIMLPHRHLINIGARHPAFLFIVASPSPATMSVLADRARLLCARRAAHRADRRRRHAGRHLDAEFLFGLGRRRHRLHARQSGADHHRLAGRLVGRDPVLHHVQGHEPLVHLGDPRRLRRRDGAPPPGGAGRDAPGQAGHARGCRQNDEGGERSSSCRAMAWRSRRRSTRCAKWPTC